MRRVGAPEEDMLVMQNNLATTYEALGRPEALQAKRDVYYGYLKLQGDEYEHTLIAANNYAYALARLERSEEARSLLRKTMPVARRVLGDSHETTLRTRWFYASAVDGDVATLDEIREAVTTLEDTDRIARRVLGSAHPLVVAIGRSLKNARSVLRARETPPPPP